MRHKKFACFILTHGRPQRVLTYHQLRKQGYTGKIYLIVDNEDEALEDYNETFPEEVIVFDKQKYFDLSDTADQDGSRNVVLPARNACHDIAKDLGLEHFLELDDDYTMFLYRYINGEKVAHVWWDDLDAVFDAFLDFLDTSGAITVCFSQGGDLIGGRENQNLIRGFTRKAMNSFFCRTDRPFQFYGRLNEDATMNAYLGSTGNLMFTITPAFLNQLPTQSNRGGLTDAYLEMGTYRKSFYTVIFCPSAVRITAMGETHKRIHHEIAWTRCVPLILSPRHRKKIPTFLDEND